MAKLGIPVALKADSALKVEWAKKAIESVLLQKFKDWHMVIVNDRSTMDLSPLTPYFEDDRIDGAVADGVGCSAARNQAVEMLDTPILLPMDADDEFMPDAFNTYLSIWNGEGIVYGDTISFGTDFEKYYPGREYCLELLLDKLFMPVASLHRRKDWERVGGWSLEMEFGLEDWEYWIKLGEIGVCGHHIAKPVYRYRRHDNSRLAYLQRTKGAYGKAYATMRDLHKELYNGRIPEVAKGCWSCGGRKRGTAAHGKRAEVVNKEQEAILAKMSSRDRMPVKYVGKQKATFHVKGRSSRVMYVVPGPGMLLYSRDGKYGVLPQDLQHLLKTDGGRAFELA